MKATFIDFEDSFTYNVIQELEGVGFEVEVISWKDFDTLPPAGLLVVGPGPGHPDDYQRIFPLLRDWLKMKRPFFGVCLGHQIFWRLQDEEVIRSREPLHGQKVKLEFDQEWKEWLGTGEDVYVQRYNSLAVLSQASIRNPVFKNFTQHDEILITLGEKIITYQFHPESVGTSFRKRFMMKVCSILSE